MSSCYYWWCDNDFCGLLRWVSRTWWVVVLVLVLVLVMVLVGGNRMSKFKGGLIDHFSFTLI